MIKTRDNKILRISILVILILMLVIIFIPQEVFAEEYDTNLSINTVEVDGTTNINVDNIDTYLKSNSNKSRKSENKYDVVLRALRYSDEEINMMSDEYKEGFLSASSAQVNITTYAIETNEIIPPTTDISGFQNIHKLTITARIIREGKYYTNSKTYAKFRVSAGVEFDRSNFYNPQIRLQDVLAMHLTTETLVIGEKSGYFVCDVHNMWNKKYKSTSTSVLNSKEVKEYPSQATWGLLYDLPGNSLANGYTNFRLGGEFTVGVTENFNYYASYAHKRLAGSISVSTSSAGISFGGTGIDTSPTPLLSVII